MAPRWRSSVVRARERDGAHAVRVEGACPATVHCFSGDGLVLVLGEYFPSLRPSTKRNRSVPFPLALGPFGQSHQTHRKPAPRLELELNSAEISGEARDAGDGTGGRRSTVRDPPARVGIPRDPSCECTVPPSPLPHPPVLPPASQSNLGRVVLGTWERCEASHRRFALFNTIFLVSFFRILFTGEGVARVHSDSSQGFFPFSLAIILYVFF